MHNIVAVGLLAAVTIFCLADVFPHTTHTITRGIGGYEWRVPSSVVSGTPAWLIDTISAVFYISVTIKNWCLARIHSEVLYLFHVCTSQFVDSLDTCSLLIT